MKRNIQNRFFQILTAAFIAGLVMSNMTLADSKNTSGKGQKVDAVININNATEKELAVLPGIGKKKAKAIITYRKENGKFSSVNDLKKVEGIGKKTLENIKEYITVEGG
jgi:competence protein ComEA